MKIWVLFAGLYLLTVAGKAQQKYDASLIPADLLTEAGSVIRYSNITQTVNSLNRVSYHVKEAITVLNSSGDVNMLIWHNKTNLVKYIQGSIYNAKGKLITNFGENDFSDVYAGQDFSLFEDSRVEHYEPHVPDYPYTVEYEYEILSTQSMVFYDWTPNAKAGIAIENSTYSFICKPDFKINFKEINTPQPAVITTGKHGLKTYTWQVNHLKAASNEPYSPDADQYLTKVKIAPLQFEYGGIKGAFTNWQQLGQWIYDKLLNGRDALPPQTVDHIKQLIKGIADPKEKAKRIYEYMQHKTRYISIQVGIGGYQPFMAQEVDETGYGDCKALVNYTEALLKVAGINSYYCMVAAGSQKKSLLPHFASIDQGNHVILCIPFKNDTTWLECTSEQIPFGFLSSFTDDRLVLACTPNGGEVLHTPRYTAAMNTVKRTAEFTISDKGTLSGSMTSTFSGTDFDDRYGMIKADHQQQIKNLADIYPINNLHVEKLELTADTSNVIPVITERLQLNANEYVAPNSGNFYFKINPFGALKQIPNSLNNRTREVYINRGYTQDDQINYLLPAGYHIDRPLLNKQITNEFGSFSISMTMSDGKLSYKRHLQINDGTYSKDTYKELVNFFQLVYNADYYPMAYVKDN